MTFLKFILVLGFMLGTVSPFCQKMGGDLNILELCGVDGAKTIIVDDQQRNKTPTTHVDQACQFCLTFSNTLQASDLSVAAIALSYNQKKTRFEEQIKQQHNNKKDHTPRAPPVIS